VGIRSAFVISALVLALPAGAVSLKASLRITDDQPVTVAGAGFRPQERVTVRYSPSGEQAAVKTVRASRVGRFTVVFLGQAVPECAAFKVTAVGNAGSRARMIEIPPPCGISPQP
jgi:hypothetical protein